MLQKRQPCEGRQRVPGEPRKSQVVQGGVSPLMGSDGWTGDVIALTLLRAAPSALFPTDNSGPDSFFPPWVGAKCPGLLLGKGLGVES